MESTSQAISPSSISLKPISKSTQPSRTKQPRPEYLAKTFGIKVRDFAYEALLKPARTILRHEQQIQPGVESQSQRGPPLERTLTEPALEDDESQQAEPSQQSQSKSFRALEGSYMLESQSNPFHQIINWPSPTPTTKPQDPGRPLSRCPLSDLSIKMDNGNMPTTSRSRSFVNGCAPTTDKSSQPVGAPTPRKYDLRKRTLSGHVAPPPRPSKRARDEVSQVQRSQPNRPQTRLQARIAKKETTKPSNKSALHKRR